MPSTGFSTGSCPSGSLPKPSSRARTCTTWAPAPTPISKPTTKNSGSVLVGQTSRSARDVHIPLAEGRPTRAHRHLLPRQQNQNPENHHGNQRQPHIKQNP